jgi:7,8-dihydropterin-6-yl-methyl-4-(beta-D-ribofuranosyl)aminobenzene 5'-phosphate synthase
VYAQRKAFDEYYSKTLFKKKKIGIDPQLKSNPRIVLLDGGYAISEELILFTTLNIEKYKSGANKTLYSKAGRDDFSHEHSLMILGDTNVLIMGCGHAGVVNILEQAAPYRPDVCVGGFHLWNPTTEKTVPGKLLEEISLELAKTNIRFYTCHCTGQEAYQYFSQRLPNMNYLSCGETIEV